MRVYHSLSFFNETVVLLETVAADRSTLVLISLSHTHPHTQTNHFLSLHPAVPVPWTPKGGQTFALC